MTLKSLHPMQKMAEATGLDMAIRMLDARRAQCENPTCDKCLALLEAGTELLQTANKLRSEAEAQIMRGMNGAKR